VRLLLDTHALILMLARDPPLPNDAQIAISDPAN
jgi:PIN domain nuclease of toxin-antitoxin system